MTEERATQLVSVDGSDLRCTDTGSGKAVLVLQVASIPLAVELATGFRVVGIDAPNGVQPKVLAHVLDQLSIDRYFVIADSHLASAAIAHTIESGDSVEALILLAPPARDSDGGSGDLEQIKAPTLVLFGTRDEVIPPEAGRIYAQQIPTCYFNLVYDAGHDIGTDRPQALHAIVRDFLERGEQFLTSNETSAINP
jgi:pimeloyl-ACP methyl ester carboxylesterase